MKPTLKTRIADIVIALGKAMCYLFLFVGMQTLVSVPYVAALTLEMMLKTGWADQAMLYERLVANTTLLTLISGLLTIVFLLVFYLIRRKKLSEALWLRPVSVPVLLSGAAMAPGLYLLVGFVLALLPASWTQSYDQAASGLDNGGVIGVIAIVIVAPIVEEFIFRGLIMTRLSKALPNWLAAGLAAAIFGACHGEFVWFCYAFVLGLLFGLMDLRAGSIWPSILAHLTFNGVGQLLSALSEQTNGESEAVLVGGLLLVSLAAVIADRKAIIAMFRPAPLPAAEPSQEPGKYDFDPWEI